MLKSNNFQHYKLSTLSFLNIKIPSFSFLKKAILGLYKNLFWHISRKIGKILENFQKVPFKALLKQQKIFSKSLMKMDRFPKKNFFIEKSNCHNFWRFLSYSLTVVRTKFLAGNQLYELQTHRMMMMWWWSKKSIAIFGHKQ